MSEYLKTILTISIHSKDENPIFGMSSTHVSLDDEAGGPFLVLKQCNDQSQTGEIRLVFDELSLIVEVANELMTQIAFKDIK